MLSSLVVAVVKVKGTTSGDMLNESVTGIVKVGNVKSRSAGGS